MAEAIVCLLLLFAGAHLLGRRIYNRTAADPQGSRCWRLRWTAAGVGLFVLMFGAGIAATGVAHQTAWLTSAPEPLVVRQLRSQRETRRSLREIGDGIGNFEAHLGVLPVTPIYDDRGRMLHGWGTFLLPYMVYNSGSIDKNRAWSDPVNREPMSAVVPAYLQKGVAEYHNRDGYALSHFAANVRLAGNGRYVTLADLPRGAANTLAIGESAGNFKPWGDPTNWRDPAIGLNRSPEGFGSRGRNVVQFVMADGSVRSFTGDADPAFLALISGD